MCTTCGCGQPESSHHHTHDHQHNHSHHHEHAADETTLKLEADILGENNRHAAYNRGFMAGRNLRALNLVSSPGSGKTSLLEATVEMLASKRPVAVIEGDQQTSNDADRITARGARAVQINTLNGCHLDAHMVGHALADLDPQPGSIVFIENVGNLVCPAMFDLGEDCRVVVISVTEGDDKPLKYPYMFAGSQVCVINKIDLLPYVDCNLERLKANALTTNPDLRFFEVSATRGDGLAEWVDFLLGL